MTTDEIKIRIRKLLNVAANDASTDGEIDNAMRFAKSLMDKHHLSEEDLVQEPEDQKKKAQAAVKSRYFATIGSKAFTWEGSLGVFVSDFVGVGVYLDHAKRVARRPNGKVVWDQDGETREGRCFCFYGIAEDAAMAVEIYYDLWASIRAMAFLKFGDCYRGDGGTYCQGFVSGLAERIEKAGQQERFAAKTSTALILIERREDLIEYKMDIGKSWLKDVYKIKLCKGPRRGGARGSADAYNEGKVDGRRAEIGAVNRVPKLV